MYQFLQDIRFGWRMLAKKPGFTTIAILTLALGIGANTAIFSVVNSVLLKPLPFSQPEQLVAIHATDLRNKERIRALSYPDFVDLRSQSRTIESMAAHSDFTFTLTGVGQPLHLRAESASADLFTVLRAAPELGRTFLPEEGKAGSRVVVLSHGLWKSIFASDPNIAGRSVQLNGQDYRVVGVMPADFQFPLGAEPRDLWTTTAVYMQALPGEQPMTEQRGAHFLSAIGRMKAGVSVVQANADLNAVGMGLKAQYPDTNGHFGMAARPEMEALVGDVRPVLLMVVGAVALLLLIACGNTANLLLARGAGRQREIAIRTSLGAGRGRVVRQLLTESMLLSVGGGVLGLLLAVWGTKLLANMPGVQIPRITSAVVDWHVLLFALGISILTGVVFGLAPALHALKFDQFHSLREGGRSAMEGSGSARLRNLLVISEVSLALILLIGATLLTESMVHLMRVPAGFEPHGLLTFNMDLPDVRYGKPEQSIAFYKELLGKIRVLPGVQSASGIMPLPFSGDTMGTTFQIDGRPVAKNDEPATHFRTVGVDYFKTMRIPLLAGRVFTERDDRTATAVVIINQTLAKKYFPNEDPIGKRVQPGFSDSGPEKMREIVGVVADVKHRRLWESSDAELYVPYDQAALGQLSITVRTAGEPMSVLPAVREQVKALDSELPLYQAQTMDEYVSASAARRRFTSVLLGVFAVTGFLLAIIGLFGVMSYGVSQRTHEMGVRLAIGAEKSDILRLIVGQGMGVTLLGIVIGLAGTMALSGVLRSQLFGVSAWDPMTFVGVAGVLTLVALAACYLPARRATRVDPVVALRYE